MITAFLLLNYLPGDRIKLQQAGFTIPEITGSTSQTAYNNAYYSAGMHLPVFYLSVTTLAVPDSFYRVPDKIFRRAIIKLSLESGAPEKVYRLLKKDYYGNWRLTRYEGVNIEKFASLYHNTETGKQWSNLQSTSVKWKRFVPFITFNKVNQFHRWLFGEGKRRGILEGNLGISSYSGRKVWDEIRNPLKITFLIAVLSLLLSGVVSVALALWLSAKKKSIQIRFISPLFLGLYSIPVFWLGTWLLYLFANPYGLQLFPASGYYNSHPGFIYYVWLLLPVFCNAFGAIIFLTRILMEGFMEENHSDYSRTAMAKGVPDRDIRRKHQLKNLIFPAIVLLAVSFPVMMNGSVLVEQIFSVPGLGSLMIRAVQTRDAELLTAFFLLTGVITILIFQLIDVTARLLDPRIRVLSQHSPSGKP